MTKEGRKLFFKSVLKFKGRSPYIITFYKRKKGRRQISIGKEGRGRDARGGIYHTGGIKGLVPFL